MKFGVLNHNNNNEIFFSSIDLAIVNIGDYVQSYGVENAYHKIGIKNQDIEKLEKHEVFNYKGEKLILTMNNVYSGSGVKGNLNCFPTPKDIVPLFIGINCHDENVIKINRDYFRKWQPIGCRDEKTFEFFQNNGIDSFISGCSSIMFTRRNENREQSKIYLVDVPKAALNYIPKDLKENAQIFSQNLYLKDFKDNINSADFFYNYGKEILQKYSKEAKLVITSKLHCLAPCIAMGIPTILLKDNIDYRFSWIDKFLPLYDKNAYSNINWNIEQTNLEEAKKLLLELYKSRIYDLTHNGTETSTNSIKNIHNFYLKRKRSLYNRGTVLEVLDKLQHIKKEKISIFIWGAGRTGGLLYDEIVTHYANVDVRGFVDSFKNGIFKDKLIIKPSEIIIQKFDFIFLCSLPGKKDALKKMKELNLREETDFCQLYFEPSELGG